MKLHELTQHNIPTENDLHNIIAVLDEDILIRLVRHIKRNHFSDHTFCESCNQTAESTIPDSFPPECNACGATLVKLGGSFWNRTFDVRCECGHNCFDVDGTYSLRDFWDCHANWENHEKFALLEVLETYLDNQNQTPNHRLIITRVK